jgi:hypothetical protein
VDVAGVALDEGDESEIPRTELLSAEKYIFFTFYLAFSTPAGARLAIFHWRRAWRDALESKSDRA